MGFSDIMNSGPMQGLASGGVLGLLGNLARQGVGKMRGGSPDVAVPTPPGSGLSGITPPSGPPAAFTGGYV